MLSHRPALSSRDALRTSPDLDYISKREPRTHPMRATHEFDLAAQLAAERGWMVPAYTLPPDAEHVKIMRALVKQTLGRSLVQTLGADIAEACATLREKGPLHPRDRRRVKSNAGY
jgi:hypothetical protein